MMDFFLLMLGLLAAFSVGVVTTVFVAIKCGFLDGVKLPW